MNGAKNDGPRWRDQDDPDKEKEDIYLMSSILNRGCKKHEQRLAPNNAERNNSITENECSQCAEQVRREIEHTARKDKETQQRMIKKNQSTAGGKPEMTHKK